MSSPTAPSAKSGLTWGLLVIALVAALLYLLPATADIRWLHLLTKPIPVLCMAVWVAWQPQRGRYQVLVASGLVLGAAGDVLLELGDSTFILGLLAFLLGHVAYIIAFLQDDRRLSPVRALLSYGYGIAIFAYLLTAGDLGAMLAPVAIYMLVICTMLWRGLSRLGAPAAPERSAQAGAVGSVLFIASDSLLSLRMFVAAFPPVGVAIMLTYWLGQLGVAASARITR